MQSALLVSLVVLLTSIVALKTGARWLGLNCLALGRAGLKTLETVGIGAIFFGVNLAVGTVIIAVVHALTGFFLSRYILSDVSLLGLSVVQGMVFAWWHSASEQAVRSRNQTPSPGASQ